MPQKTKVTLETVNENVQLLLAKVSGLDLVARAEFNSLRKTVEKMSHSVARIPEIEKRLTDIEKDLTDLRARVDNLFGLYEKLDKRIERLEHEYLAIAVALKRLEQHYERLEADRLAERVQILEQRVAALEKGPLN